MVNIIYYDLICFVKITLRSLNWQQHRPILKGEKKV